MDSVDYIDICAHMLCVYTIIITKEEIMNFEGWEELGVRVMKMQ